MKIIKYIRYIKSKGFKNYWYYLRLSSLMRIWGCNDIPKFDELLSNLRVLNTVMDKIGITVQEFQEKLDKVSE